MQCARPLCCHSAPVSPVDPEAPVEPVLPAFSREQGLRPVPRHALPDMHYARIHCAGNGLQDWIFFAHMPWPCSCHPGNACRLQTPKVLLQRRHGDLT